jgi:serine/threonine protein kinase
MPSRKAEGDGIVDAIAVKDGMSTSGREPVKTFVVRGTRFEVAEKYTLIKAVGKGAYGVVCSCRDVETGRKVAVKKVEDAIVDATDAKRTLREIKLLRFLNHENIIALVDIQPPATYENFTDVYEITELMDTDLHQIIRSKQPLTEDHFMYFMYQLFCSLKYLHSAGVWHRDLKPGNLLVNRDCDLKLCDFGLARFVGEGTAAETQMTEYVVTRWYRAPELILTRNYSEAIDIWAAGCILAEMLGRKPIFPGKDYMDQISKIIAVIGTPPESDMGHVTGKRAKTYIKGLGDLPTKAWSSLYPQASELALDLLNRCLTFDPTKRITATEALAHPYFEKYHDEEDEPSCSEKFSLDFEFEKSGEDLSLDDWRELVWQEVCHFHPECRDATP